MSPAAQDIIVWSMLAAVLFAVAKGHPRFELFAITAVLVLGGLGIVPQAIMLAGFAHPALATIVALYVVGQAIRESGMLTGLGTALEHRVRSKHSQVLGLSLVAAGLSAFMSNVGALAALLPTASRMARRAGIPPGRYGLPISLAAILGGTLTLVGSAPTVIVSGYRAITTGVPFRMFDFFPQGVAILGSGVVVWMVAGRSLLRQGAPPVNSPQGQAHLEADASAPGSDEYGPVFAPFATPRRRLCLLLFVAAVAATSMGIAPPAIGFGLAATLMVFTGVLSPAQAYAAIDLHVVLFLGSMLSMGRIMEHTGTLGRLTALMMPLVVHLPRLGLLGFVFLLACLLGNVLNNAASAAVMAPLALQLGAGGVSVDTDALLMAVAAGACLAVALPTHQAVLMGMSQTGFEARELRAAGWRIVLLAGLLAIVIIERLWA